MNQLLAFTFRLAAFQKKNLFFSLILLGIFIPNQPLSAGVLPNETPVRNPKWAELVNESLNLFKITPTLYRSEQLQQTDIAELTSLGIKTVVSLRAFHSDEKILNHSGIVTKRIRILTWQITDAKNCESTAHHKSCREEWCGAATLPAWR